MHVFGVVTVNVATVVVVVITVVDSVTTGVRGWVVASCVDGDVISVVVLTGGGAVVFPTVVYLTCISIHLIILFTKLSLC